MTALPDADAAWRLAIAALIGLGVGLEREWSGHTSGADARFAGIRTFLFLGAIGGIGGELLSMQLQVAAAISLLAGVFLSIAAFVVTTRRPGTSVDGTTETAAILVVLLGALAGIGMFAVAAGAGSVMVLALREKSLLHSFVRRVDERELQAGFLFAVLALVILPVLPSGPFGHGITIQPRLLWSLVLIFSAINFLGYIARRALGPDSGYPLAGTVGGLISSTAVTLTFARRSHDSAVPQRALAHGVLGACTLLVVRVLFVSTMLNPRVGVHLVPLVSLPLLAGTALLYSARHEFTRAAPGHPDSTGNPLRLGAALQMAVAFQIAINVLEWVTGKWGMLGIYPTAALLGLADMDALTLSMSRLDAAIPAQACALAIAIGLLSNTMLKAALALLLGTGVFRSATVRWLLLQASTGAVTIIVYYWRFIR